MSVSVVEIMTGPQYQKFRDLCRETRLEAQKLDLPSELIFAGVAWDFQTMFKVKVDRAVKKLFEEQPIRIV